ncbi:cytochrome P450 [Streptomyces sp. NBC_01795]|uniref:cytochrome P450 n=1 Tax=Streptomyces sp. NBC_01795 TaxID=2975943 RepID=UPI002DD92B36|nr:cytochrome P450 [Streptomyces sp. NBC_01795]WSA94206.1 cytochrome P450 [Streptomyces sp. NBC_01795]
MSGPVTGVPDVFDPRRYAAGIPHEAFRALREEHPVAWQEEYELLGWPAGPGFWAVTRHADVLRVLRSPGDFSSWEGATQIRDPEPEDLPFIRRMMLNQDPPAHKRLRTLVSRAFTPRRVERFEAEVRARARRSLTAAREEMRERGSCDLVAAVTDDFALLNLADLLGVPPEDRGLLLEWTERVIGYQDPEQAVTALGPDGRPANPRSPAMLREMFDYAGELAAHKREHPADDVMTALAHELTGPELEMFFFLLTVAGNDTVRSAAPGGLLALAEHPVAQMRLRALVPLGTSDRPQAGTSDPPPPRTPDRRRPGPAGTPGTPPTLATALEELLRWHTPVLSFRRTAVRDTELAGRRIRAGEKVVVFHASANYDERVFPSPHTLDLSRSPNPHLAFGEGPHVCLGAHFARLQLRALHEESARLLPPYERVPGPGGEVRRLVSNFIHGVKCLPLRLAQ